MNWTRFVGITICSTVSAMLLTACGSQTQINPAEALEQLKEQIVFTDQFEQLDKEGACRVYAVDENLVEDSAALAGSGATAESLSVWKANDADSAKQVEEQLNSFVEGYIEGYSDYKPEEVPKLESAVLSREGIYVVLCISADNAAAEPIIEQLLHP